MCSESENQRSAAGYIRASSGHPDNCLSVTVQKEAIEQFAEEHGLEIVGWYVDEGSTGGDADEDPTGSDADPSALQ